MRRSWGWSKRKTRPGSWYSTAFLGTLNVHLWIQMIIWKVHWGKDQDSNVPNKYVFLLKSFYMLIYCILFHWLYWVRGIQFKSFFKYVSMHACFSHSYLHLLPPASSTPQRSSQSPQDGCVCVGFPHRCARAPVSSTYLLRLCQSLGWMKR